MKYWYYCVLKEKVTKNLSLKIKEKGAVLNVKKLPVLHADESQMIQLVQNLVENSIKFSTGSISSKSETHYFILSRFQNQPVFTLNP